MSFGTVCRSVLLGRKAAVLVSGFAVALSLTAVVGLEGGTRAYGALASMAGTTTTTTGPTTTVGPTTTSAGSTTSATGATTSSSTSTTAVTAGAPAPTTTTTATSNAATLTVAGQDYQICTGTGPQQYLTSSWTYDALSSGSATYTAAQYEALSGYGSDLPPLPAYLADQPSSTDVATVYAPGQSIDLTSYNHPGNPELFFFEGGNYGSLSAQALSGDEYIGGSAPGYGEPVFNGGNSTGSGMGIQNSQDHYAFNGAGATLASTAPAGATSITLTTAAQQYTSHVAFADPDGLHVYGVSRVSGDTVDLRARLRESENGGAFVWYDNGFAPLGAVTTAAPAGSTTVSTGAMAFPVVPGEALGLGSSDAHVDLYYVSAVSGSQSGGYTLALATPLGWALPRNAPVYYVAPASGVSVEYLTLDQFAPADSAAISLGADNTIEHDLIENGGATPNTGTAIRDGADNETVRPPEGDVPGSTIEYNCIQDMANGGMFEFGNGSTFAYNEAMKAGEVSGTVGGAGEKWWGTENSTILDNAFVDNLEPPIWFDDGNTGYLVEGNYFYGCADRCINDETSFNGDITGNLFTDSGWDSYGNDPCGGGECAGVVNLDDSGAWPVPANSLTTEPASNYNDELLVQGNVFDDDWQGVTIWGEGNRSCLVPGELQGTAPYNNSPYCSGGYPNGDLDFTNYDYPDNQSNDGSLQQGAAPGGTTIYMTSAPAVNDQLGFSGPGSSGYASDSTTDTTNVSTFTGSGVINAASDPITEGFATPAPSCGTTGHAPCPELMVATSKASYQGQMVGAVLSYSGITSTQFTGVDLVRGSGDLGGPSGDWISPVEPYTVTAVSGSAPDYKVTINPGLSSSDATLATAGAPVYNDGTCELYDTPAATPSGPLAPDGLSYFDGCIWENRNISVSGNTFDFDPTAIANGPNLWGNTTYQACDSSHADYCGTNFMAWYVMGPSGSWVYANALMSQGSFNAPLSSAWESTSADGEPSWDDTWSNNTYIGPWQWYVYGANASTCTPPSGDSCSVDLSQWQSEWGQDNGSTETSD